MTTFLNYHQKVSVNFKFSYSEKLRKVNLLENVSLKNYLGSLVMGVFIFFYELFFDAM